MLCQLLPREAYIPRHICINGTNLNAVEHLTYLGSVISIDATVRKDLNKCLSKASLSFGRLSKRVWQSHPFRLFTKIQLFKAVVVPSLLYGAETWVLYRKQIRLYLSGFTNTACAPSLASLMARLRVKRRDPQESQPAQHRGHFRCSCAGQATSQGWKTYACPKQSSSAMSKKESVIVALQESVTKTS